MQSTFSRRAFVTALGMLSVPLIALAQEKQEKRRRATTRIAKRRRKKRRRKRRRKRTRRRTRLRMRSTTGTRSSMPPGPIAARTGGRIDGAMQSSDESLWGSLS